MNVYIKSILAFNVEGEKRHVDLTEGLNVITGESKSGKSALLEIIDYCLGSSKSTIPKGEVTKFGHLFALILKFQKYHLVVARKRFDNDGKKQMYLYRTSQNIIPKELSMDLFTEENILSLEQAKIELGREFGIAVTNSTENIDAAKNEPRPSVRNMTSYMFQHQNLVASKFALFYRFEDSQKREQTIKQFPVFAGWVDQQYYNYRLELDELLKQQKRNEKLQQSYYKSTETIKRNLLNTFKRYYMLVGKSLDDNLSLNKLLNLRRSLPDFTRESYLSEEMEHRYGELKKQREELKQQRYDIEMGISNLELSHGYGQNYSSNLKSLKAILNHSLHHNDSYNCPLCGQGVKVLSQKIISLNDSKQWLVKELASVKGQGNEFYLQIHNLNMEKDKLNDEIRRIGYEISKIEAITDRWKKSKKLDNEVVYARAEIDIECKRIEEQLVNLRKNDNESDIRINELNKLIEGYNLYSYYSQAATFIKTNITRVIEKLDFEEEFRPADMNFLLDTFDLYHYDKESKSRVYLSEMGSGANWLACHVSLFLSLLHFFAIQEKSAMPSILFLDQPSQVYFPEKIFINAKEKSNDVLKVEQIYKTIIEEIDLIEETIHFKPQVIITDHVGELDIEDYNFEDYLRKNWRGSNKFI
ncbi:DUF3732 domain-containing protein [Paenibacillus polymyxa]|uniref:DUF3732 domain-containing protein n=1 Tax=Paenibacillus polymyxa TaxID=1406 RepID=UPI0025B724D8|nr:DUF3732 domain-containing protein [Paenibacillus polymyxa]MDN4084093.1 DUF3732 domain-containing protein [Paenibacillus polymyxa]MDN4087062.1 DUF3732 domain-containing protein [Paenibacillus polymyxa]MDN4108683.1 DUF3732 domain-containing protein [Paenibacillus polymyxa]MEE4566701.1 DUF3732 domain-containing protein [Paenibacillus polymyxa]